MEIGNLIIFSSERPSYNSRELFFRERRYVSFAVGFLMPLKPLKVMQTSRHNTTATLAASYTRKCISNGGCSLVIREINPIIPKLLPPKKKTSNKHSKTSVQCETFSYTVPFEKNEKNEQNLGHFFRKIQSLEAKTNATKGLLKEVVHIGVALT